MIIDILMFVDTKGARMFRRKNTANSASDTTCDSGCRAAKLRDETLFKIAQQGPRI
jgi:hypothetical protein